MVHLEEAKEDEFDREISEVPGPVVVEGESQWVVEKIVRAEVQDGLPGYVVKWKGYSDATWEPEENIRQDVPDLVRKFHDKRKK